MFILFFHLHLYALTLRAMKHEVQPRSVLHFEKLNTQTLISKVKSRHCQINSKMHYAPKWEKQNKETLPILQEWLITKQATVLINNLIFLYGFSNPQASQVTLLALSVS